MPPRYLVLSSHDYRSRRRANIHFIADELAKTGQVNFFSTGFSLLSLLKRDPRSNLLSAANRIDVHEGVACYFWVTPVHPFNMRSAALAGIEKMLFDLYAKAWPGVLRRWVDEADVIVVESGVSAVFLAGLRRRAPKARLIYNVSDDLRTIGCAGYVETLLQAALPSVDVVRVPSPVLSPDYAAAREVRCIPHGIDKSIADHADPSPYGAGRHAVSVGSMMFDPGYFDIAARAFPDVTFHVIGAGARAAELPKAENLVVYDEMPFRKTLPYVKHADVGVAPYASEDVPPYLTDTSLKLAQYDFFGLPAVCPASIAGAHRFGYRPGDAQSIRAAFTAALAAPRGTDRTFLSWAEVAEKLVA